MYLYVKIIVVDLQVRVNYIAKFRIHLPEGSAYETTSGRTKHRQMRSERKVIINGNSCIQLSTAVQYRSTLL